MRYRIQRTRCINTGTTTRSNFNNQRDILALDDENWARKAQAGDRDAYDELVRRHQRAALRVAATIAGPDRAADAAQEGFLRAHLSLDRFDPDRPFRPWLLHIVANAAKNEVRSAVRHQRLALRATTMRVGAATPHDATPDDSVPAKQAVQAEERQELIDALSRLSVDDRLVLALRWFEELTEAEMAEVLEVRPGTVKSRIHRAMTRLRTELIREGGDDG